MTIKLDHLPVDDDHDVDTIAPPIIKSGARHTVWPQRLLTMFIVLAPFAALGIIIAQSINDGFSLLNLILATVFYVVIAHGVTIGFHRYFTHGAFRASRPLKITLGVLGSMSFQGSLIGWVADHRRHHMFSDKEGDPHSPVWPDTYTLRGLGHAHMGWFFKHESSSRERFAPDLLADRDLVVIDKLFVPFCVATLVLPFALGWAITGSFGAGVAAFLWAGVLRVGLFHHVSWATNSLCHVIGKRPFRTTDRSSNVAPLAVLSMGEAWHNAHHAFPSLARHGVDRFQVDTSAFCIRLFERFGWATRVRWPERARLETRRVAFSTGTP